MAENNKLESTTIKLSDLFEEVWGIYQFIDDGSESTSSDAVQVC